MANAKIDSVKLSGGTDIYYFDLPSDATPNITSLTTGTLNVSGTSNLTNVIVDTINGVTVPATPKFTDTIYTLPSATKSTLGGVKIGTGLNVSSGVVSVNDKYTITISGTTLTIKENY